MSSHGTNWLSSSAAGRMNSSLLRREPIAIRLMIGSSRSAVMPVHVLRRHRGVVDDDARRPWRSPGPRRRRCRRPRPPPAAPAPRRRREGRTDPRSSRPRHGIEGYPADMPDVSPMIAIRQPTVSRRAAMTAVHSARYLSSGMRASPRCTRPVANRAPRIPFIPSAARTSASRSVSPSFHAEIHSASSALSPAMRAA